MPSTSTPLPAYPDSKQHFEILDGLRGVASVMVIIFHLFEPLSTGHLDQIVNHGYLAVDFFYLLSGFVIAYAYDDRWSTMTITGFFKRRLIRLHPMIVMGMIVGAIAFYFQGCSLWPGIAEVPVWKMLLVMLIGFTLIPVPMSMDIRGWGEMHPLNGPAWSLFFEYLANILYALVLRKSTIKVLGLLVLIAGIALVHFAVTSPNGDVIGGWSVEPAQFRIGLTRVMYPFLAGILLFRIAKLQKINYAFLWSSLMIITVLSIPRIGGADHLWMNGLYDSLCIIFLFPAIVYIGASGKIRGKTASKICKFLGDISYPLYITHFPLIYIYTAWVADNKVTVSQAAPVGLLLLSSAILIAYLSLKLFDIPVRSWLRKRFTAA